MTNHRHGYSDQPTTSDELGFTPSADALLRIIDESDLADTPLTIGIFGPWGSGKTSLMQMLRERLDADQCIPVWFDAWRYAHEDALWRALLISIVEELRQHILEDDERVQAILAHHPELIAGTESGAGHSPADAGSLEQARARLDARLDDLLDSLYRNVDREELGGVEIDWKEAGKTAATTAIRVGFSYIPVLGAITKALEKAQEKVGEEDYGSALFGIFRRQRSKIYRDHVRSLEQFYRGLQEVVQTWVVATGLRLVVFIDDLDRCLPEQAVGVLEAIKVFLDIPGCMFVLGLDREIIERGIRVRYKEFALDADTAAREGKQAAVFPVAGRDYLEKIIQVSFELPPLERTAIENFLRSRLSGLEGLAPSDVSQIATLMTAGLLRNPRKIKRTFNTFRLLLALGQAHQRPVAPALVAKLVVIQSSFPPVYEQVVRRPAALREIEQLARDLGGLEISDELKQLVKEFPLLKDMLYHEPFFTGLTDASLGDLVFQTRTTQGGTLRAGT